MTENMVEAQNLQAQKACRENYSEIMREEIGGVYVKEDNLLEMHQKAKYKVLNLFDTITTLGEEQSKQAHREYLEDMIDREYSMLFQINYGKKIEARGKILEAYFSIRNTYETAMDQVTADENAIDEKTLNEAHKKYLAEAMETWKNITEPDDLKIEFFSGLNVFIERKIGLLRRNNEEKQRIAKAEEQKRKTQELYLEKQRKHIQDLRKKTLENYIDEVDLQENHDEFIKNILDVFKSKMDVLETLPDIWDNLLHEDFHLVELCNEENKIRLENRLEGERNKAYEDYDGRIKQLLNDTYMEESDLRSVHDRIVVELLENLKSEHIESPIILNHLEKAKTEFEKKYSATQKLNKKNRSYIKEFYKFLKQALQHRFQKKK